MSKRDKHRPLLEKLTESVLRGPGVTSPDDRQQAALGAAKTPELAALLEKVQRAAYQVTDKELQDLLVSNSEDALFELTSAAALGAAMRRLEAGLKAIEDLPE